MAHGSREPGRGPQAATGGGGWGGRGEGGIIFQNFEIIQVQISNFQRMDHAMSTEIFVYSEISNNVWIGLGIFLKLIWLIWYIQR